MSYYTFKTKNISKKLIHDANYHECRKLFPNCPSQIIIRAKDSVYATYKTIKSNKQLSKMSINHPISFSEPIDGKLNLTGRLYQLANRVREKSQMQTPRSLV